MSSLAEIEEAIEQLPPKQFLELVAWLEQRRSIPEPATRATVPDFLGRAQAVWGEKPPGIPLSEVISKARN